MSLKGIFQEGMKEYRRKSAVSKEQKGLKDKAKVYETQLTALGQKAWESKIDISSHGNLYELLSTTESQQDVLKGRIAELQKQKQETEDKKKQENDQFESKRKAVEETKRGVDHRLNEEKNLLKTTQKDSDQITSRLSQIPKDRDNLSKKLGDAATPEAEKNSIRLKLDSMEKEESDLKVKYDEKSAAIKVHNDRIVPIQEESNALQKQIDDIRAEQKKVIGDLDTSLSQIKKEMDIDSNKLKELDKTQAANFKQLGEKLAAVNAIDPAISVEMAAVRATEKEMSDINFEIGNLEGQKSEAGANAFKKMVAIIVGGVILLIVIIVVLVNVLSPKKTDPLSQMFSREGISSNQGEPGNLNDALTQIGKATESMTSQSERLQGHKIVIAEQSTLESALPNVGGYQRGDVHYSKGTFGELQTSNITATYTGPGGSDIDVTISDAGTASAMLAPLKMVYQMNITVDNENERSRVTTYNNIPVVEKYDKIDGTSSFGIILKDRYIVDLKTSSKNGMDVLKEFMSKMDFSKLQ